MPYNRTAFDRRKIITHMLHVQQQYEHELIHQLGYWTRYGIKAYLATRKSK